MKIMDKELQSSKDCTTRSACNRHPIPHGQEYPNFFLPPENKKNPLIGKLMAPDRYVLLDPYGNVLNAGLGQRRLEEHVEGGELVDSILVVEDGGVNVHLAELLGVGNGPVPHPVVLSNDCERGRHALQRRAPAGDKRVGGRVVQAELLFGEEELPGKCAHGLVKEVGVGELDLRVGGDAPDEERVHQDLCDHLHRGEQLTRFNSLPCHEVCDVGSTAHSQENTSAFKSPF